MSVLLISLLISIHALRGEGDDDDRVISVVATISIHALRGEGDHPRRHNAVHKWHFNPRPPWGGRPPSYISRTATSTNFNPRPPWGGRQRREPCFYRSGRISIHALRGEGDEKKDVALIERCVFQSTPSVGRATPPSRRGSAQARHFNPRPPWGGRPKVCCGHIRIRTFQSTPSVGRATLKSARRMTAALFQSTPSVGRATLKNLLGITVAAFQSTPSVGRATFDKIRKFEMRMYFNPRPPWGGRLR